MQPQRCVNLISELDVMWLAQTAGSLLFVYDALVVIIAPSSKDSFVVAQKSRFLLVRITLVGMNPLVPYSFKVNFAYKE